ncbi:MAG: laccase domain-containing protein [Acidimicrobiia bacterium]
MVFARALGIPGEWATVTQVHGADVLEAAGPGELGPADGLFTMHAALPIAVFSADCVPVVLDGEVAVGVAHAGWRGLATGVVSTLRQAMADAGAAAVRAAVGPAIGPCCYEVGPEVLGPLAEFTATTTWGSPSVDLRSAAAAQLEGLPISHVRHCTHHEGGFSHRRDQTAARQAAVAWMS